ncbi:MAG TPA: IS5 family transposase, partial [Blastocatellia bacterium]|nr:IS5 family transposase [Blastocatellia bacterium]
MQQTSFLSIGLKNKILKCERFLSQMEQVVPWLKICKLIEPHYHGQARTGRKPFALELMVRIMCLQQWYQLSDPGIEEAIYDRASFQRFLKLDLLSDGVPDETTVLNFRHLLEQQRLMEKFFELVNGHLAQSGLMMKEGTIVDATLIAAASSTKNQSGKRDPEMSSTCHHGKWHFGLKAAIGVDSKSGLVHHCVVTTAKVHDNALRDQLLHGQEKAVFGDKGFAGDRAKQQARQKGLYWGVMDQAKRAHPLSSSQKKRNRKLRLIRSKVEFPFQI